MPAKNALLYYCDKGDVEKGWNSCRLYAGTSRIEEGSRVFHLHFLALGSFHYSLRTLDCFKHNTSMSRLIFGVIQAYLRRFAKLELIIVGYT